MLLQYKKQKDGSHGVVCLIHFRVCIHMFKKKLAVGNVTSIMLECVWCTLCRIQVYDREFMFLNLSSWLYIYYCYVKIGVLYSECDILTVQCVNSPLEL